jgi:hypothetical protein
VQYGIIQKRFTAERKEKRGDKKRRQKEERK